MILTPKKINKKEFKASYNKSPLPPKLKAAKTIKLKGRSNQLTINNLKPLMMLLEINFSIDAF